MGRRGGVKGRWGWVEVSSFSCRQTCLYKLKPRLYNARGTDRGPADLWRRVRIYLDGAAGQQGAWWLIEGTG